jgi:hypothetical protein
LEDHSIRFVQFSALSLETLSASALASASFSFSISSAVNPEDFDTNNEILFLYQLQKL